MEYVAIMRQESCSVILGDDSNGPRSHKYASLLLMHSCLLKYMRDSRLLDADRLGCCYRFSNTAAHSSRYRRETTRACFVICVSIDQAYTFTKCLFLKPVQAFPHVTLIKIGFVNATPH